jgi:hypothetical protein
MKATYFKSADDVGFIDPMQRFWAKVFGKDRLVIKCKTCKQIPTEIIGGYCWSCLPKLKQRR